MRMNLSSCVSLLAKAESHSNPEGTRGTICCIKKPGMLLIAKVMMPLLIHSPSGAESASVQILVDTLEAHQAYPA